MSKLISVLVVLALTPPTLAIAANTAPSDVEAGSYSVDPTHTQVNFDVLHMGFTYYEGRFSAAAGELDLKPKDVPGSSVHIVVPTASVSTTSEKLDGELRGAEWLDVQRFPTMEFKSTAVQPTGEGEADVAGDLTLHGVTSL